MVDIAQYLEQLLGLGLTKYEAMVYLALLERQDLTPTQAATHAGVPRQRIYDVLFTLCSRGFCLERHSGQQRVYHAVNPAIALPTLLEERQRQYEVERTRQQAQTQTLITALTPLYTAANGSGDPSAYIDVFSESRQIAERALALAQAAAQSICVCFKRPSIISDEDNLRLVQEPLSRGVTYRTLYERSILIDPASCDFIARCVAAGQQARFVEHLPIKMQLLDDRVVLLSLPDPISGAPRFTAVSIAHTGLAQMLAIAFEQLWQQGQELSDSLGYPPHGESP